MGNETILAFLLFYLGVSLITFIWYAVDKSAARKGSARIPERTLHILGLAGGWPGAMLAQKMLRHKTQKKSFRAVFWLTVVLNSGVLIYCITTYCG